MSVQEAYDRLSAAMDHTRPECADIDLFTLDQLTPVDTGVLTQICAGCPLLGVCREYSTLAKPAAGFWGGTAYPVKTRAGRKPKP